MNKLIVLKVKDFTLFVIGLLSGFLLLQSSVIAQQQEEPNILFISIDDMNDWTTVFDEENPIKTPTLEKLADRGAFFTRAYTSSPACNPSRVSVMTGMRPHKTGIYGNRSDWRGALPDIQTIQKYFMDHGYYVGGAGKIFHHHSNWAFHDNSSFHEFLLMQINKPYPSSKLNGLDWYGSRNTDWGAWPPKIEQTPDYKTAQYAINFLQRDHEKPFFLNVGIYKPHSPFFAHKKFIDQYPKETLKMPKINDVNWGRTSGAKELLKSKDWFWEGMQKAVEEDAEAYLNFVQAYQAASTFADAMVGKIIDQLENSPYKENTIIVIWSDHGFHIGEKEHIEKFALWEKTTRIPLIIIAPKQVEPGTVIDTPVDLTALYPTLIDLAGLKEKEDLDGESLMPLFDNPEAEFPPALTTYLKGNHAIRKDNWRYIQYNDGSEELYDLSNDPNEWNNLAEDPEYQHLIDELRIHIPEENADQVSDYE